jgi:anti-sigma factor RsiW
MDHSEATRLMAAEKYLLGELEPESCEQFEEHFFGCQECARDVRAGAAFVEHSKVVLADPVTVSPVRAPVWVAAKPGWFAWLRPAFVVPVLALLAVIGYQNLVTYPHLKLAANSPQIVPWASINVPVRSGTNTIHISPHVGEGFHLIMNIAPQSGYSSYTFDLSSPSGRLKWTRTVPAASSDDARSIYVPGANQEQGTYNLAVRGVKTTGELSPPGLYLIDVQIQK